MTTNGTRSAPLTFESWSDAFDCCRERNVPIVAEVDGEVCECFPSGHGKVLRPGPVIRSGGRREHYADELSDSETGATCQESRKQSEVSDQEIKRTIITTASLMVGHAFQDRPGPMRVERHLNREQLQKLFEVYGLMLARHITGKELK